MFLAFKGRCGHWDRWVTGAWGVVGLIDGGFSRQSVLSKMVSTIISMEVLWFHVIFSFGEFHWVFKGSGWESDVGGCVGLVVLRTQTF